MKNSLIATVFLASSIGFATASSAGQHGGDSSNQEDSTILQHCPMMVAGAEVAVADVQAGVALAFTTKSGDVDDLRKRVEFMAKMHNQSIKDGPANNSTSHTPVANAKYEIVANGARLVFTPKDAGQLDSLRKQVRQHAERYANRDCSMMPHLTPEAPLPEAESEALAATELGR